MQHGMEAKSLKRKCATTHQRRVPLAAAGKHLAGSFGSALGRRLDGAVAGCANGACDALEGRVRGCGGGRWPGGRRGRGGGGSSGGGRDAASGTGCGAVDSGGSFSGRLELIVVSPSSVTSAPAYLLALDLGLLLLEATGAGVVSAAVAAGWTLLSPVGITRLCARLLRKLLR